MTPENRPNIVVTDKYYYSFIYLTCNRVASVVVDRTVPVMVVRCVLISNPFFVPQVIHFCNINVFSKATEGSKRRVKCVKDAGVHAVMEYCI